MTCDTPRSREQSPRSSCDNCHNDDALALFVNARADPQYLDLIERLRRQTGANKIEDVVGAFVVWDGYLVESTFISA